MRKMPHGQWVAFEGYDTVHDCMAAPEKKIGAKWTGGDSNGGGVFDSLGFPIIHTPGYREGDVSTKSRSPKMPTGGQSYGEQQSRARESTSHRPGTHDTPTGTQIDWGQVLFIGGIAIFAFMCLASQCSG